MNFESSNSLRDVRLKYVDGKPIFFACLIPEFDWFKKEFSISKIFKPVKTKIIKQTLFNEKINDVDRRNKGLSIRGGINQITRKYNLHLYFDNSEKTVLSLFVNYNQKVLIKYETNVIVSENEDIVKRRFYKEIIRLQTELKLDNETTVIEDEEYQEFVDGYDFAITNYPEEVI